mgnify:CR=1 FL=1|tara:strand:- start:40 stop:453 length:414 start_codon:yes stop_codon:yes gene_type:complete
MKQEYYKKDEIKQHFDDFLEDRDEDWIEENIDDIHHYAFNEDYYIIGTYRAKQWCGDDVFNIIATIREYEDMHFGEVTTDFSDPEKVVNMYVYIVGEEVVSEWLEERELKSALLNEAEKRGFNKDHLDKHLEVVVID